MLQIDHAPQMTLPADIARTVEMPLSAASVLEMPMEIELVPAAASDSLLPHWRGLADQALEANPFMAPEFILPASMHLSVGAPLMLACVWRKHARSRELTGLFPLTRVAGRAFGWLAGPRFAMWSHPLMPISMPLLCRDPDMAARAITTFLTVQLTSRREFTFPTVRAGGAVAAALGTAAVGTAVFGLQLTVSRQADAPHSRGLDIDLQRPPLPDTAVLAQEPATLRSMLEQALVMDATVDRQPGAAPAVIHDASRLAFLRAVVRGYAQTGQVIMAKLNADGRKAVGIAIVGEHSGYLWQMFGPAAHDPMAEAAIACALRTALGKPMVAAVSHPIAGFCTVPLRTETIRLVRNPA